MRRVVETGHADLLDIFTVNNRQMVVSRIPLFDDDGTVVGGLGVILYDRLQALKPIVGKFQRMQEDLDAARRQLADERRAKYSFTQFVGTGRLVRELKARARRAAERDLTVLLLGETGTGKELLAHAIHAASPRADRPMVRVNAAAIPEHLLEAELFGTVPGAYTGAGSKPRPGKFELAHGGTLFLDEVGDMPLSLQAKLLRVLQDGEVEPLGSNRVVTVDVRVIAATSRDLKAMIAAGSFRPDLYYRLNVLPLLLPALRDRPEDLPILCETLLEAMAAREGGTPREITAAGLARLAAYAWPGNVRELGNILQQAAARDDQAVLSEAHFDGLLPRPAAGPPAEATARPVKTLRQSVAEAERQAILAALEAAGGVKLQAARMLGISRAQFYEKLATLGLLSDPSDRRRAV
jgi:transcriptional regulator with PAS, ATPase and Fis domain